MKRKRLALLAFSTSLAWLLLTAGAPAGQAAEPAGEAIYRGVSTAVQFDVSPPLRSIKPRPVGPRPRPRRVRGALEPASPARSARRTTTHCSSRRSARARSRRRCVSFDGPNNISGVSPPDPVGDVGPNHYVAMSNLSFQIFNKAGTSVFGPAANNTLWAGFGGACQTENAGDPIVLHDQLADRWILTQFTAAGPTYFNCVAVSTTPDPTGTYYRYAFTTGANFPDYPKYGVWPDALYISTREFAGATLRGRGRLRHQPGADDRRQPDAAGDLVPGPRLGATPTTSATACCPPISTAPRPPPPARRTSSSARWTTAAPTAPPRTR